MTDSARTHLHRRATDRRAAALGELLRALKTLPDDSSPAPLLTDLRDEWRTEAETAEAKYAGGQDSPDGDGSGPVGSGPGMSRDWIAYRVGGADELDELLLELSGAATDGAADV